VLPVADEYHNRSEKVDATVFCKFGNVGSSQNWMYYTYKVPRSGQVIMWFVHGL